VGQPVSWAEMDAATIAEIDEQLSIGSMRLDAMRSLADRLLRRAALPIVVRIVTPTHCVLQLAQDRTTRLNSVAVARKTETSLALGRSTLWWHRQLEERGTSIAEHPFADDHRYTDVAGGVPLRHGGALVGAVAVSGMAPLDDHDVIVEALRDATT
jgi:uncharacterized protein (UPF0303 family)